MHVYVYIYTGDMQKVVDLEFDAIPDISIHPSIHPSIHLRLSIYLCMYLFLYIYVYNGLIQHTKDNQP